MARPENKIAAVGVAAVDDFGSAARLRPFILVAGIARACDSDSLQGQLYQRRTIQPPRFARPKDRGGQKRSATLTKSSSVLSRGVPRSPDPANAAVGKLNPMPAIVRGVDDEPRAHRSRIVT